MTRTDTVLRVEAMAVLLKYLGEIDAERFIGMIKTDNFDYTEWQRNLWQDKTIDDIYTMAVEFEKQKSAQVSV
jgi:hypothetical protein